MRNRNQVDTYGRARRHSLAVGLLKRALPLAALTVVGGFAYATVSSGAFDAEAPAAAQPANTGEIVMANPRLDGLDRNSRPYALKASAAHQRTATPAIVRLDAIDATLPTDAGSFASIDATSGLYDSKTEVLTLSEGVTVRDLKGLDMDLESARFDMDAGTMTSDAPVAVRSRNADIDAASMQVLESGKRILFSRRVRMVIHNGDAAPDKSDLLGDASTSTAPWIHTSKLSVAGAVPPSGEPAAELRISN